MYLNILDDNQQQKIGAITSEYPVLTEQFQMNELDVPWHWHEEVEFKYVLSGAIRVRTEHGEYTVKEGEACFTNSNILETSEAFDRKMDTEIITVIFHTIYLSGHFRSILEKKYVKPVLDNRHFDVLRITPDTTHGKTICKTLPRIRRLYEQPDTEFQIRNMLSDIWMALIQEINKQTRNKIDTLVPGSDRIRYMLQYIYTHYQEKLTLDDLADSAGVSGREALRTFKKALGKAPFDYLTEYRLGKAREFLETTDLSITDIAFQTGFSDGAYFGKVFRKYFNCTPREYRKQLQ